MDGNRRYARQLGRTVLFGHNRGARKAADVRAYWMQTATCTDDNLPQAMTVWAFSSDNHKRSVEEVHGLFKILSSEFMDMAYCPLIHFFQIRVRIIGSKQRLPSTLLNAIDILERATERYSKFYYQIAVGYGGKLEVVEAVKEITAKGEDVTEKAIEAHTICAKIGVPPVDLIVRTSERRTSGFFLWGTQSAELHFIDKLWPLLTFKDWCDSLLEFNTREVRNGA
ncbi:Decaprenyl diphosphate synthase-like protein [Flagelloscypha sp. PMI_526]|nr:Decaprenyl diphosphate synthase-like protein [Flagelloscypha sp. PMI_526]